MNTPDKQNFHSQIQDAFEWIEKGKRDQAQMIFNQISHARFPDLETLVNFGILASRLEERVFAINALSKAVETEPDNTTYLDLLAKALIDAGMFEGAKQLLQRAIELKPDFPTPYMRLGAIEVNNQNYVESIPLLEKAMALKPSDPTTYSNILIPLRYTDRHEEALKYAQKLIKLEPKNPENHERLGRVLIEMGRTDEAIKHFEKAIRIDPGFGVAYYSLASNKKFTPEDKAFIRQCEKALQSGMPAEHRSQIHFSMGKYYDDCKQWPKAFEHIRQGNMLRKPGVNSDKEAFKRFQKVRKTYTRKFIEETRNLGNDSEIPVFVVGMPRSGTTLIEQIIASHPAGAGAGELTEIDRIEKQICPYESLPDYKKQLQDNLTREKIDDYAETYLRVLRHSRENAGRIVDKMPDNFFYLGLINLLFPNARIIHSIRHPLDIGLSCYFQAFTFVYWSYDLEWIAARYRFYREAMDYWKKTLPEGRIVDVHYENLIETPDNETRRLIEACGLPWDDKCLNFHKDKRTITTASVWQARQPIYKSSKKRWSHYAEFLGELANGISDYLSDEDLEELRDHGVKVKKKWRWKPGR